MDIERKVSEINKMKRVWDIYTDDDYRLMLDELANLESSRVFCRHGFDHLIDTARLAYIFSMERGYGLDKSLIYAAALLHDIGRVMEYKDGTSHDEAGEKIAKDILIKYDYNESEIKDICEAIGSHRSKNNIDENSDSFRLASVLKDADKLSRNCFLCRSKDECNWSDEKKNLSIIW